MYVNFALTCYWYSLMPALNVARTCTLCRSVYSRPSASHVPRARYTYIHVYVYVRSLHNDVRVQALAFSCKASILLTPSFLFRAQCTTQ